MKLPAAGGQGSDIRMERWMEICWKRTGVPYARAEMCRGFSKTGNLVEVESGLIGSGRRF
jgi:hypothetical protein